MLFEFNNFLIIIKKNNVDGEENKKHMEWVFSFFIKFEQQGFWFRLEHQSYRFAEETFAHFMLFRDDSFASVVADHTSFEGVFLY